jgi:hypothetical protein
LTGVGKVLKSMGAHGLDAGVSPGVAEFMGSLPLGLLKATKGAAELTQSGQRWQGTKDVAGGALDASQIPGGFVAPEAGELAGAGKQAGVDPNLVDKARADWKQAQSLYDLDSQLKMSTSGMRPEMATPTSTPETVDPRKAFDRLNKLYNSGRLQQAVGQSQSEQIIQHADAAFLEQAKILARQKALKTAGKITGTGAAIGAVGEGVKAAKDVFGGSQ